VIYGFFERWWVMPIKSRPQLSHQYRNVDARFRTRYSFGRYYPIPVLKRVSAGGWDLPPTLACPHPAT
jgi:hypothetical protein